MNLRHFNWKPLVFGTLEKKLDYGKEGEGVVGSLWLWG